MKKLLPIFFGILCTTTLFSQTVRTQVDERHKLIGEFLAKSEVLRTIDAVGFVVASQLPLNSMEDLPACLYPDRLKQNSIKFLLELYNKNMFVAANAWLSSPTYSQLLTLLNQELTDLNAFELEHPTKTITALRRALILRLNAALQYYENTNTLLILQSVAVGSYKGRMSADLVELATKNYLKVNNDFLREASVARLSFIVRGLSDEQLDTFVQELEQPVPQWALACIRGAVEHSLIRSIPELQAD